MALEHFTVGIKIRKIEDLAVVCWYDSILYASGEPLEDNDLEGCDKHQVYNQGGCLIFVCISIVNINRSCN